MRSLCISAFSRTRVTRRTKNTWKPPYEFYGPHYTNVDTALSKFIPLHEALQLEARAECFNCLNHTNYANPGGAINGGGTGVTNPGTALSAGTFGTITAANPPRILQLSLKVDF